MLPSGGNHSPLGIDRFQRITCGNLDRVLRFAAKPLGARFLHSVRGNEFWVPALVSFISSLSAPSPSLPPPRGLITSRKLRPPRGHTVTAVARQAIAWSDIAHRFVADLDLHPCATPNRRSSSMERLTASLFRW